MGGMDALEWGALDWDQVMVIFVHRIVKKSLEIFAVAHQLVLVISMRWKLVLTMCMALAGKIRVKAVVKKARESASY